LTRQIGDPRKGNVRFATVPFTLRNLKEDLEDVGSRFDGAPELVYEALGRVPRSRSLGRAAQEEDLGEQEQRRPAERSRSWRSPPRRWHVPTRWA
jgi:hypothetical protein